MTLAQLKDLTPAQLDAQRKDLTPAQLDAQRKEILAKKDKDLKADHPNWYHEAMDGEEIIRKEDWSINGD